MLKSDLEKIGLTSSEAKIYDYLIIHGDTSASELARKIQIGRTNIYDYAKVLTNKGLVTAYEKRTKIYYHAEDPKLLKYYAEEKVRENQEIKDFTINIIPKISEIYEKNSFLPQIENIYGEEGFERIQKRVYLQGAHHEIYYFVKDTNQYSPPEPKYHQAVFSRDIITYLFAGKGSDIVDFQKRDKKENRMTIQVGFDIDIDILICEDILIVGDFRKKNFSATVIKSFPLVQTFMSIVEGLIPGRI